ncbi:MAG TPA: hypothetical protein VNY05_19635 [Candidatus Acidoferrales bacterium]|jgi:hypothetical protein|nr:hypothetical protein [Candidatus Acidoferrales bacterium]
MFDQRLSPRTVIVALGILFLPSIPLSAQQTYVTRFDAYGGYAFLNSPHIGLFENGFAAQFGIRPRTWYSFGLDYSFSQGDLTLTPELLPAAKQASLGALFGQLSAAHQLPPGYALVIPARSRTQTFAVGPQLAYRHFEKMTLFLRPVFAGAIHELATPHPGDAIAAAVVSQLAPSGTKTDTAGFVGFGGGFDVVVSRHFSLRTQADVVYDHLFNDLLNDGRWTVRFSVGPAFNFGKNIAEPK